jgi:hypothetical protein
MLVNTKSVSFSGSSSQRSIARSLGLSIQNAITGQPGSVDAKFAQTEAFLTAFAHAIIVEQAAASGSTKTVAASVSHRSSGALAASPR